MNYGPLIFLTAFCALAGSWYGLVLKPQLQVGQLQTTNTIPAGAAYPVSRPGLAREGSEVYRANGCAQCHSQQATQTGIVCDVILTDAGTNQSAVVSALERLEQGLSKIKAAEMLSKLPATVLHGVSKERADAAAKALKTAEAKTEVWILPAGPDIARGWGKRRSVAEDFLYDYPVMLGSQRVGPDLANVGSRLPDANWHLLHLYNPRLTVKSSLMPPYRFLFETRDIGKNPSPDAFQPSAGLQPPPGKEIIPKPEAKALVAYLMSLHADAPLFVAPVTVPAPPPSGTNAVSSTEAGVTNATPTNAPAK